MLRLHPHLQRLNLGSNGLNRVAKTVPSPARAAAVVAARVDAWLVGAFLVVFAGAIATTAPAGSASLQDAQARAGKSAPGSGVTESAPREAVRAVQWSVRALLPKSFGKDFIPVRIASGFTVDTADPVLPSSLGDAPSVLALAFQARAPPHLM